MGKYDDAVKRDEERRRRMAEKKQKMIKDASDELRAKVIADWEHRYGTTLEQRIAWKSVMIAKGHDPSIDEDGGIAVYTSTHEVRCRACGEEFIGGSACDQPRCRGHKVRVRGLSE